MNASDTIISEVTKWPGVETGPGPRGGELSIRVGKRELGHLHGDHAAHFGFPKALWAELREQGRIVPHPVFPDKPGPAARRIASEEDVRDVIALLRLNYDRISIPPAPERPFRELAASAPQRLPFGRSIHARAFKLHREGGDLLVYSVAGADQEGATRQYLNHSHEAAFGAAGVPVFCHAGERAAVEEHLPVRATFSRRHTLDGDFDVIPTPGHTPGATAYLWDSGGHRFLFTGDTIYLRDGEWVAALLDSSDRAAYVESLDLLRELDFDVLVPWISSGGGPYFARTDRADARRRIGAILDRLWRGGSA
jgi:hypothetical protein